MLNYRVSAFLLLPHLLHLLYSDLRLWPANPRGRAMRSGLYIAALVAARHNPVLREFYQRLRAAGKPPTLA
jgi:hypothetical protein